MLVTLGKPQIAAEAAEATVVQGKAGERGCHGGVQPSHRPKAGKYERFSLLRASHSRPKASQASRNIRLNGVQAKGYCREDLIEPVRRYVPKAEARALLDEFKPAPESVPQARPSPGSEHST